MIAVVFTDPSAFAYLLARFERCATFDDKRQFLIDFVERVVYDCYRVTVIGSVPIKMQLSNSQEIETREIAFRLRGEIDKTTLHNTKPNKKFAEGGQMDAYGSGGRKPPTISRLPLCAVPSLLQKIGRDLIRMNGAMSWTMRAVRVSQAPAP